MDLVTAFVNNPIKVTVGVLLVSLFGVISALQMPMQLTPEVQTPTLTIETRWPGASPQEVEQEIVQEQEEQLKSVEGMTKLSSESLDSLGRLTLEFNVSTNMDEALLKVNSRLQQVPSYPENADQPVISTSSSANQPIAWFILTERPASPEQIVEFQQQHPELRDALEPVRRAHNVGLRMFRLEQVVAQHPAAAVLLPAKRQDVTQLRKFCEDVIEAQFERVPGVANSNVIGGLEEQLEVIVDPEKLAARQLTVADVRAVLRGQNRDTSGGDFWEGKRRWVVRTLGQFRSAEQVEQQLLAVREGRPVFVRDVAEVRSGFKKPDGLVRRFGAASIAVNCLRSNNANVLEVMNGLRATLDRLNTEILGPSGLQLTQVYDETEYIYSSINLVRDNIFLGGALTMVVLMVFLHLGLRTLLFAPLILGSGLAAVYISPWMFAICLLAIATAGLWYARGALVIGLAIPASIVGTFLILALLGRSLNVISLAGLAFAVGMVVDNAIVVLESIYSRAEAGEPRFQAAVNGTRDVWGAVVSSTLTTVAVFLPVVFIQEEAGQLFRDIALAIAAAVSLSLLVAITVIPPAAARVLRGGPQNDRNLGNDSAGTSNRKTTNEPDSVAVPGVQTTGPQFSGLAGVIAGLGDLFTSLIVGTNRWLQSSVLLRVFAVLVFVGGSAAVSWVLWPAVEYLPNGNRNLVFGILVPPPGYNIDELTQMGQQVENDLRPFWDVDLDDPEVLSGKKLAISDLFFVSAGRRVFIGVKAVDPLRARELIPLVQGVSAKLPGTFGLVFQASLFGQGLTAGRQIDLEITGPELTELVKLGGRILGGDPPSLPVRVIEQSVFQLFPGGQARPVPSLDLSSPEVHVTPRLLQSAELGISAADLGYTVDALVDGAYAGDYITGGEKIDLVIRGRDEFAQRTQDLDSLPIATPSGNLVPLSALADVKLASGPEQINHRERERAITIAVNPAPDMPLETALSLLQTEVIQKLQRSNQMPPGTRMTLSGTADKLRQTWEALKWNVVLALLITYLLMAALYESWVYPLVIIFSVPLGATGGVLGLQLLSVYLMSQRQPPQTLDVLTMLGFIILIGTVVNNAILIVDHALQRIREGERSEEAILDAARTRIRPIFMTTITTVLGLLPLVLFPGAGSELYRGLGSVVLGGLLVSTVFTLVLIPCAFRLMLDLQGLLGAPQHQKK